MRGGVWKMSYNETVELLLLEADNLRRDMEAVRVLLGTCPVCSVKRAGTVKALAALSGTIIDVMARLRALREGGAEA